MTQQIINTGTGPNAQDGDSLYVAFTKVNDNFNSIWAQGPVDSNLSIANNAIISTDVNGNIVLTPNGIGYVRLDNNTIPGANNAYFLGDSTRRWRGIWAGSAGINTTGNLYAGNLIVSGNTEFDGNITFTGSLDLGGDLTVDGNITGGGSLSIPGNITAGPGLFYGDVGITGNLQVAGNIVYIDVEELRIEDPIIELGGGPNGTPLTSADGFSRGLQLDYFNVGANAQQIAFTGLAAPDYTTYQFLTNATNTANTYTGTPANLYFGNANVTGQVSVAGNINTSNAVNASLVNATNFTGSEANITGNIYSGNIINQGIITSVGNIVSTSNVAGAYFIGNGAFLTGVITSVSNIINGTSSVDIPTADSNVLVSVNGTANVAVFATSGAYVNGIVSATGNVVSNNFIGNTVSVTANINGGNIRTTGLIVAGTNLSAAGNVIGNYILGNGALLTGIDTTLISNGTSNVKVASTNGNVEINIAGNNIATYDATGEFVNGIISATGTIVGGYLYSSGELSAAGNVVGNNLNVTNVVSAGGNVYGGNVVTGKLTTTAGNLTVASPSNIVLQPAGNVVLFDHYINGVADPVQAQDAATKSYVDNAVSAGLNIHEPVYVERPDTDGNLPATYTDGGTTLTVTDITNGNTLTTSAAHGLAVNDQVVFDTTTNGLVASTAYFVYSTPAANQLILADAYDGEEITTLTDGTGLTLGGRANSGVGATLINSGAFAQLVLDGVTLVGGERVLIYTQDNAYENGVYIVTDAGTNLTPWVLTRANDSDKYIPNSPQGTSIGDYFFVQAGDTGAGESYVLNQPANPIIFGISGIDFVQFSSSQVYKAGLGLELDNTTFNVLVDTDTLEINGSNEVAIKAGANLVTPNIGDATGTSLSLTGNITAGNASIGNIELTSVSVTGNVVGGNLLTAGIVSATGDITGANINGSNLLTSGLISATGNITGANIMAVTFYGNVKGGNVSLSANVIAGNVNTAGNVSANAVLTDNYYYANGAPIDFQQAAGSNTQIQFNSNNDFGASANLTFDSATNLLAVGGNISATGNITGGNIIGNFVAPAANTWVLFNDAGTINGVGQFSFNKVGNTLTVGTTGGTVRAAYISTPQAGVDLTINPSTGFTRSYGNFVPQFGNTYDLGTSSWRWNNFYANVANVVTLNTVGNITGGNVLTGGLISATGTITGANITGDNLLTGGLISATGNLTAGNITTAGHLAAGPADFTGDVNIVGNLNVDGNVTYIDVKDLRVEDPIIDLGGGPNGAPLTTSDGFSRGLKLEYFNATANAAEFGFMGLAASDYTTYQLLTNATDTGNTFTGTAANLYLGNLSATGNIATGGILTDNYYYANGQPLDMQQPAGSNTWIQINNDNEFGATTNFTFDIDTQVLYVGGTASITGNAAVGGILTDNYYYANGQPLDMQQPAGSNTWIQFNNNNDFGASANLAFDSATNQLTVTGIGSFTGNIVGGNLKTAGLISATGNIDGGNLSGEYIIGTLETNAQPNITSVGTLTSLSVTGNTNSGNLRTAGQVSATGNVTGNIITGNIISSTGNAYIAGNLYISGNVTYINITDLNVQDPIISMGRGPNNTPLTVNDGKDRGEQLWYYDSQERSAFIGWHNSTGNLIAATDVTNNNEIITVNNWGNLLAGNLYTQALNSANLLFVDTGSNVVTVGNSTVTSGATFAVNATDSMLVPIGNTFQRPSTPVVGMIRFNTTLDAFEYYSDVDGWTVSGGGGSTSLTSQTFTADGSTTVFNLTNPSTTVDSLVMINGVTQIPTSSYSIVGTTLTFTEAPEAGDTIEVREIVAQSTVHVITNSSGNASVSVNDADAHVEITGDLIPSANVAYNLGSPTAQWNDLYLSGNTIYIGGNALSAAAGNLTFDGNISAQYIYGNGAFLTGVSGGVANLSGNLAGNLEGNGFGANALSFISATGNITGGNIATGGLISATGNISTTANISGGYVLGNAAFMTGIPASYGNADVVANLAALGSNPVSTTGNVTAGNLNATTGVANVANLYMNTGYVNTAASAGINMVPGSTATGTRVWSKLVPNANVAFSLGSTTEYWANGYIGNTISTTVSAAGNITGGNLLTGGLVSVTGNITGGNVAGTTLSGNLVGTTASLSANVTSGNILTGGLLSATGNLTSGNISTGIISASGNVTAQNFIGNISITGNITGTSANVSLVAGAYTATFDNTGTATFPGIVKGLELTSTNSNGDEGGQLNLNVPVTNTSLGNSVTVDVYQNKFRIFEGSANAKGVFVDLNKAPNGVGGELLYKASNLVNAGVDVTLGNLKARIPTSGNRSLQVSTVSGTYSVYGSDVYQAGGTGGSTISNASPVSITTTPTYLNSGLNFTQGGYVDTWTIMDTSNTIAWRITLIVGASFNNNMISIERLL